MEFELQLWNDHEKHMRWNTVQSFDGNLLGSVVDAIRIEKEMYPNSRYRVVQVLMETK